MKLKERKEMIYACFTKFKYASSSIFLPIAISRNVYEGDPHNYVYIIIRTFHCA